MKAKNSQREISFRLWHTQTYDHHMLQGDIHLKPFQPLRVLNIVEIQNPHHDDKACLQQYGIAEIGNRSFVIVNVRVQAKNFGFGDK